MKGVYVLLININDNLKLKIDSLGILNFEKGKYVYVGSAQNSIERRIARHKSRNKKNFWHIDYLLNNKLVNILGILYKEAKKENECKIAQQLNKLNMPILKFGCSDCNCQTHLFKIKNFQTILNLKMKELKMG